jgi:hypothetical protein
MKLGKSLLCNLCNSEQKLLYTVNRIKMSPASTLNIYLFEGPILQKPLFVISVVKKIAHSSHSTPQNYSKPTANKI